MNRREFISATCGAAVVAATCSLGKAIGQENSRLRRVQVLHRDVNNDGTWVDVQMKDVRKYQIFRMFEPDGKEVVDDKGGKIWVATEDARQSCSGAPNERVWGCKSECPGFPVIMHPGKLIRTI